MPQYSVPKRLTGLFSLAALILLTLLACISLRKHHAPWRLEHEFLSGLDEEAFLGRSIFSELPPAVDVHPDGKRLAIGRQQGHVDEMDLSQATLLRRIELPLLPDDEAAEEDRDRNRVYITRYLSNGQLLLASELRVFLVDADGTLHKAPFHERNIQTLALSPERNLIAASSHSATWVYDVESQRMLWDKQNPPANGSFRMSWSEDGQRFLLKDLTHLWLYDATNGELLWESPELDFRRDWPHYADEFSGYASQHSDPPEGTLPREDHQIGGIRQAILSPDGERVWVTYETRQQPLGLEASESWKALLRCIHIERNEILWEQPLSNSPRDMGLSQDGHLLFLQCTPDFSEEITLYDTESGKVQEFLSYSEAYNSYPGTMALSPTGSRIIGGSNHTWIFSFDRAVAPFRLLHKRMIQSASWLGEQRILLFGMDSSVRIFTQVRRHTPLGLLTRWESILLYGLGLCASALLLYTLRRQQLAKQEAPLPWRLWATVGLVILLTGFEQAGDLINLMTREFYDPEEAPLNLASLCGGLFLSALTWWSLYRVMRLSRGWYHVHLFISGLALLISVAVLGFVFYVMGKVTQPMEQAEFYLHGWMLQPDIRLLSVYLFLTTLLLALYILLLRHRSVRIRFSRGLVASDETI